MEIKGDPSLKEAGEGEGFGGWRKGTWAGGRSLFGETPGGKTCPAGKGRERATDGRRMSQKEGSTGHYGVQREMKRRKEFHAEKQLFREKHYRVGEAFS